MKTVTVEDVRIVCHPKYYEKLEAAQNKPDELVSIIRRMSGGRLKVLSISNIEYLYDSTDIPLIGCSLVLQLDSAKSVADVFRYFVLPDPTKERKMTIMTWGNVSKGVDVDDKKAVGNVDPDQPRIIEERFRLVGARDCLHGDTSQIYGRAHYIKGEVSGTLKGDVSQLIGDVSGLEGYISDLLGQVDRITGDITGIRDKVTNIRGDVSTIYGNVSNISGDVSRLVGCTCCLSGDVSNVYGTVSNVRGDMTDLSGKIRFIATFAIPSSESRTITAFLVDDRLYFAFDYLIYTENDLDEYIKTKTKQVGKCSKAFRKIIATTKQLAKLQNPKP